MDEFDFKEERTGKPTRFGPALLNCASIFFLIAALALVAFFALLFLDPQNALNPFPPLAATSTQAPTSTPLPATATLEPTATQTATATLEPTATPAPIQPSRFFVLQEGDNPAALDSSVFHPELACNFMGVAGQVFGPEGTPLADLQVRVYGTLNNEPIDKIGVTGAAVAFGTGEHYEIQLANQPVASDNTLQVVVQEADGTAISAPLAFSTSASCEANLIMINFTQQP